MEQMVIIKELSDKELMTGLEWCTEDIRRFESGYYEKKNMHSVSENVLKYKHHERLEEYKNEYKKRMPFTLSNEELLEEDNYITRKIL
jgi:ribosome-binding protein aMBF1 (putative translation factor)